MRRTSMTMIETGRHSMTSKEFKALRTKIYSLKRVFTWSDLLVGIYINDIYYDRTQLTRKQLQFFEYFSDFERGEYPGGIIL